MTENQNDPRNLQSGNQKNQEQTQDGKRQEEINPNNAKTNQNNPQDPKQGNQQRNQSDPTKGYSNTDVQDTYEIDEEATDETTIDSGSKINDDKSRNENSKKGNM